MKGDNDGGLDMRPLPGPGVSQETLNETLAAKDAYIASEQRVKDALAEAMRLAEEQADWAEVAKGIVGIVQTAVGAVIDARTRKAAEPVQPSQVDALKNQLLAQVGTVLQGAIGGLAGRL